MAVRREIAESRGETGKHSREGTGSAVCGGACPLARGAERGQQLS